MVFDMEGDPLFDGGLEYLFGIVTVDDGEERFHAFWAHDRDEEKAAFQQAADFMVDRLRRYPDAHIYHYAAYEETALKRLAMFHGTRSEEHTSELQSLMRISYAVFCLKKKKKNTRNKKTKQYRNHK